MKKPEIVKKPELTKAERRAKQEADRATKAAGGGKDGNKPAVAAKVDPTQPQSSKVKAVEKQPISVTNIISK